jgi:hypothetical protein
MNASDLIREIIATYERHGWRVRRVLLRTATRAGLDENAVALFATAEMIDSDFEALWFIRSSHGDREAWELRLIAEHPYALFEAFEKDESEEAREEVRREMEKRMREHIVK